MHKALAGTLLPLSAPAESSLRAAGTHAGKNQLAAPDDARFREKRPQVLHRIQPVHARKGNHSVGRCIFARDLKEHLPARGNSPPSETDRARSRTAKAALCKKSPASHSLSARQCRYTAPLLSFLPSLAFSAFSIRTGMSFQGHLARKPRFRHEIPFSAATEPGNCAIIRMKEF